MYVFACPFGFTYGALFTLVLFELHLFLYFLNRFEIPAYANGNISALRPRYFYTTNTITTLASSTTPFLSNQLSQLETTSSTTAGVAAMPAPPSLPVIEEVRRPNDYLAPSMPARNVSATSFTSSNNNDDINSMDSRSILAKFPSKASIASCEGGIQQRMGTNKAMQRELSFSTPLEEIIAYEQAMERQHDYLDSQEEMTASAYGRLPRRTSKHLALEPEYAASRNTSVSSLTGTFNANSSHRHSLYSDSETVGNRDIGLALFGSDSGEISDSGFSRSNSMTDLHATSTSELKNVSKDLQFELSKQIQNQQMQAMMVFDLPVAPSPSNVLSGNLSARNDSQNGSLIEEEHEDFDTSNNCERDEVKSSTLVTTNKRSSVFSLFSNLKWGKSKMNSDGASISSLNTTTTVSTTPSGHVSLNEGRTSSLPEIDETEVQCSVDSNQVSLSNSDFSSLHAPPDGLDFSSSDCISLSSPLASTALENLQPRHIRPSNFQAIQPARGTLTDEVPSGFRGGPAQLPCSNLLRQHNSRTTTQESQVLLLSNSCDDEYIKETEGFSIFGVYDDCSD